MTREEVDAKIAASEARTDTKFAALIGRIDALIVRLDDFEREMREEIRQIKADMADFKKTVMITVISTGFAVVFGVAGFNATLLNNMTASYESGKDSGQWRSEITQKLNETTQKLNETNEKIDRLLAAHEARLNQIDADLKAIKQERGSERK